MLDQRACHGRSVEHAGHEHTSAPCAFKMACVPLDVVITSVLPKTASLVYSSGEFPKSNPAASSRRARRPKASARPPVALDIYRLFHVRTG